MRDINLAQITKYLLLFLHNSLGLEVGKYVNTVVNTGDNSTPMFGVGRFHQGFNGNDQIGECLSASHCLPNDKQVKCVLIKGLLCLKIEQKILKRKRRKIQCFKYILSLMFNSSIIASVFSL